MQAHTFTAVPAPTVLGTNLSLDIFLTTSGAMYHKAWSLSRFPPNHDDRSSEGNVRCSFAQGTKKSTNPQSPMKNRNDAADRNGWYFFSRGRWRYEHGREGSDGGGEADNHRNMLTRKANTSNPLLLLERDYFMLAGFEGRWRCDGTIRDNTLDFSRTVLRASDG